MIRAFSRNLVLVLALFAPGCASQTDRLAGDDRLSEFMGASHVSLEKAIEVASAEMAGAELLGAFLEIERNESEFEVVFLKDGEIWEVEVDAVTAKIVEIEHEGDEGDDDEADEDEDDEDDDEDDDEQEYGARAKIMKRVNAFAGGQHIGLADALAKARTALPGGEAIAAGIDIDDAETTYEVVFYKDGEIWEVELATSDGAVLEVEQEGVEDDEDEGDDDEDDQD